ncbi:MAG TPA: FAD-binding and (Fe-S)-binding domain-containing protein [Azospirillaceae bacterium]|nr:FAD-binding and (Fe-S)-binding domain-containing protein [Azospirillaceae bacterium]
MPASRYDVLCQDLEAAFPRERLVRDPLRRLAYGTDASFYRLIPEVVAVVESEAEVIRLIRSCRRHRLPLTFRAAGTSLSGQAVSDSVMALLGDGWNASVIAADGSTIRLRPGVIGAEANRRLAPFGRKIGPDPASINAAKIGGIAANNASGMCCGTAQNSYRTLEAMRVILADGTLLDTADPASRQTFAASHGALLDALRALGERTRADQTLADRIRHKFKIKNTTGYSLNALVDFTDPFDILQHLMIGSEGTLGFIAEITYRTVPEHPAKASALLFFPTIAEACRAVTELKATPVSAAELMDRAALHSVEDKPGMPGFIRTLGPTVTALLVETRAADLDALLAQVNVITRLLDGMHLLKPAFFTADPAECEKLWKIRKGLFPAVGAVRDTGTTVIIEDVAFPLDRLAEATVELQDLMIRHGYHRGIIFGHALEGNLHFVFTQGFGNPAEVERYRRFMDDVCRLVVDKYDGSLKAEHGTGRNMAPFVELEWGAQAYDLMREIKALFDPEGLLNPGVILNDDPEAHLKNLKPLPPAHEFVDTCIECGFCEPQCPSRGLTLTPRQRIVGWREISRQTANGDTPATLSAAYDHQGIDTCAACGLCTTACPVGIETGALTKVLRGQRRNGFDRRVADLTARHIDTVTGLARLAFDAAALAQRALGDEGVDRVGRLARRLSGDRLPLWSHTLPTGARFAPSHSVRKPGAPCVVYMPSCASRTMGPPVGAPETDSLPTRTAALLAKAGYEVVYPRDLPSLCCGQPFDSKGLPEQAASLADTLAAALDEASEGGTLPIVFDTSPCALRMKSRGADGLPVQDIVEFIHDHLMNRLTLTRQPGPVMLHTTCSTRRMGLDTKIRAIAEACVDKVVPADVGCCGFAGDKGFTQPDLNAHALRTLKEAVPEGCTGGYSTSRTCEIGLSFHGGTHYRSIVYLLDDCSEPAPTAG